MQRIVALVAALTLVVAVSGCQEEQNLPLSGAVIQFSLALAPGDRELFEELLEEFRQRTGAVVRIASVTGPDLWQRLRREAVGQPTLHLVAEDNVAVWRLLNDDLLGDLTEAQIPGTMPAAVIPDTIGGRRVLLPFRPTARVAYANTVHLADAGVEAPATFEQLVEVARQIQQTAGSGKVTLSLAEGDPRAVTLAEWIVGFGGDPLVLNDPGSVDAFTVLSEMWSGQLLAYESQIAQLDTEVTILTEEIAWIAQNWPFTSGVLYEDDEDLDGETRLDRFSVYQGWAYPQGPVHVLGGDLLGIPANVEGREREAAVALAEYLMSAEVQDRLLERSVWVSDDLDEPLPDELTETVEAVRAALDHGWYRPRVGYWPTVRDAMNEAFQRIVIERQPVQSVLDEMHQWIVRAAEEQEAA